MLLKGGTKRTAEMLHQHHKTWRLSHNHAQSEYSQPCQECSQAEMTDIQTNVGTN